MGPNRLAASTPMKWSSVCFANRLASKDAIWNGLRPRRAARPVETPSAWAVDRFASRHACGRNSDGAGEFFRTILNTTCALGERLAASGELAAQLGKFLGRVAATSAGSDASRLRRGLIRCKLLQPTAKNLPGRQKILEESCLLSVCHEHEVVPKGRESYA